MRYRGTGRSGRGRDARPCAIAATLGAAAIVASGCQVDLESSPCERTAPYAGAANLYADEAASAPRSCTGGDGPCLLVATPAAADGVAVSLSQLFYSVPTLPGPDPPYTGLVCSVRADGLADQEPEVLIEGELGPNAVAADGDFVAWAKGVDGQLVLRPLSNPSGGANSSNNLVDSCIALDQGRLYFTRAAAGRIGALAARPEDVSGQCCCGPPPADECPACGEPTECTGEVEVIAQDRHEPQGTTALGGVVYFAEGGLLRRIGASGRAVEDVVAASDAVGCMAAAADVVFVPDTARGEIWAYSFVGECRVPVVSGIHALRSVALDDGHLYWSSAEGIWRLPRPF